MQKVEKLYGASEMMELRDILVEQERAEAQRSPTANMTNTIKNSAKPQRGGQGTSCRKIINEPRGRARCVKAITHYTSAKRQKLGRKPGYSIY